MPSKCWCYANDWNAQKQDKDLLGVFLSLSGKSGLDQSLTPSSHYSHIGIVVALLMLLCLPSGSKMAFAGGGIDKITWFYLFCARLDDPGSFSAIFVKHSHSTAQPLSLWNWICAIQGGAALGDSSAMARSSFRTEGHGQAWVGQGETGNPGSLGMPCGYWVGSELFSGSLLFKNSNPTWSKMVFRHKFPTFLFSLVLQATKYPSGPGGSGSVEWHG